MQLSLTSVLGLFEGLASLAFLTVLAIIDKVKNPPLPHDEAIKTEQALHDLWSLNSTSQDVSHNFLQVPRGLQLHYLSPSNEKRRRDLIIFLHGFPDSCYLWAHMLASPLSEHASLVSVDLPGYGGSDGLPNYGPGQMLNTMESAIKELRLQYGIDESSDNKRGQCIVVGHDWGGIVASRVAAGTEGLIDHLVLVNSLFPRHALDMAKAKISRARELLRTRPSGFIRMAKEEAACVVSQLAKSHYTFMFNLPFISAARLSFVVRFLLRACHKMADAGLTHPRGPARSMAASLGPGVAQCKDYQSNATYSASVLARAMSQPDGIWDERIRLYKERLMTARWNPAYARDRAEARDEGCIRCSTTVIFGIEDQALDPRLMVDGIDAYVRPESGFKGHVVKLSGVGHWSPLHSDCVQVLNEVLVWQVSTPHPSASSSNSFSDRLQSATKTRQIAVRIMR